jgi:hypothetical protein
VPRKLDQKLTTSCKLYSPLVQRVSNPSKSCELVTNLIDQYRHVEIEKSGSQSAYNPKRCKLVGCGPDKSNSTGANCRKFSFTANHKHLNMLRCFRYAVDSTTPGHVFLSVYFCHIVEKSRDPLKAAKYARKTDSWLTWVK